MKKEYTLIFIVGLFLLAYVLDAVVEPLGVVLSSPYQYINPSIYSQYPFTGASIVIKALGIFLTPLFFLSFMEKQYTAKGLILLIVAGLTQLYGVQELATGAKLLPIEWTVSLALGGAALLAPMIIYFIRGTFSSVSKTIVGPSLDEDPFEEEEQE
ncbi:hypothetical protein KKH23_03735 [Patescibacteria group bacterium]|nr:hypothetical protein [Patescibacteria group bacterium]MBU0777295.1 hypothetical protein [Patescibacteria group bacterium]MBU0846276.1 hypothetical protein [Patescibacteria group bacterium]MBU0923179.1 hypothetical protein [Patescibacteria group bacterium]MBU1066893.1 hypothetical protein [Patescibacteria group bacterium]